MANANKLPATGNLLKTCRWIVKAAELGNEAKYCERPVNSFVTRDEERNKVRKFESFCPMHKYEAEKSNNSDIEGEGLENV